MGRVGRVDQLWRYPVKGLRGERRPRLELDRRGVVGDRSHAVRGADGKLGSAKTTRRFRRMPGLLTMAAEVVGDQPVVRFADGAVVAVTEADAARRVGEVVGEPVALAPEGDVRHLDAGPVHLLTTASLAWLQARLPDEVVDPRRFRPNVVIACPGAHRVEEDWLGAELAVGSARLRVEARTIRCVTPALPQDGLGPARSLPGELQRANGNCLGVYASVLSPGTVAAGDAVHLVDRQ